MANAEASLRWLDREPPNLVAARRSVEWIINDTPSGSVVLGSFLSGSAPRNIDNGSLVQSGSTFMYTLMHPDVIRTQVFIPQDEAFGLGPGVDAVIRVPRDSGPNVSRQGDADRNRRCSPAAARC